MATLPRSELAARWYAHVARSLIGALLLAGCSPKSALLSEIPLANLDGASHPLPIPDGTRAVVVVFVGVECPISNRCLPELKTLQERLSPKGVRFFHVYPNPDESAEIIRRHRGDYLLGIEAFRDPEHRLARKLNAHCTPEAVAFAADGRLIYRGRVNDQFIALGVGRPQPTRHDLAEALDAFLGGAAPGGRVTLAVGCTFRPGD